MHYKRTYISGAITGTNDYIERFKIAQMRLDHQEEKERERIIINPVEHNLRRFENCSTEPSWEDYMREDIKLLCDCDTIYMLKGWEKSLGATIEFVLAKVLKLKIIFEEI